MLSKLAVGGLGFPMPAAFSKMLGICRQAGSSGLLLL
jgi:hypothetical protein